MKWDWMKSKVNLSTLKSYVKLKEVFGKYSTMTDKEKDKFTDLYIGNVSMLAYDELLDELSAVKQKNQEIEAKLDKVIQLLESK